MRALNYSVLGLAVLAASGGSPAQAAVRVCQPPVTGRPARAPTIAQAQKLALAAWFEAAKLHGDRFGSWRIAHTKSLICSPASEAGVLCVARASPCVLQQNPDQQVPEAAPKVLKPGTKALNI